MPAIRVTTAADTFAVLRVDPGVPRVERMAVDAMRLPRRFRCRAIAAKVVLAVSDGFEVLMVDARRRFATTRSHVIDLEPVGDRADEELVSDPVGKPLRGSIPHRSVARCEFRSRPDQTAVLVGSRWDGPKEPLGAREWMPPARAGHWQSLGSAKLGVGCAGRLTGAGGGTPRFRPSPCLTPCLIVGVAYLVARSCNSVADGPRSVALTCSTALHDGCRQRSGTCRVR